jgi:ketosteroid isomerase-like protein
MQNNSMVSLRKCVWIGRVCSILLLFGVLDLGASLYGQSLKKADRTAILETMHLQEEAWNTGDLEGFMHGYWENDSLRFIGKSGITFGWQHTLDNYKRGYPDLAAMGKLTFTILRVEGLSKRVAHVTGQWHLQRAQDAPHGYFTLLWRKIDGRWVIVADHSS